LRSCRREGTLLLVAKMCAMSRTYSQRDVVRRDRSRDHLKSRGGREGAHAVHQAGVEHPVVGEREDLELGQREDLEASGKEGRREGTSLRFLF
jgi:hypothetical protein